MLPGGLGIDGGLPFTVRYKGSKGGKPQTFDADLKVRAKADAEADMKSWDKENLSSRDNEYYNESAQLDDVRAYANDRPSYGKDQVEQVWNSAKQTDGKVYDPNTGVELKWDKTTSRYDQWHMGHKPGKEYWKYHEKYMNGEISEKEFLKIHRDPAHYQPEHPKSNMSHAYEEK